jgi:hypothetical protein
MAECSSTIKPGVSERSVGSWKWFICGNIRCKSGKFGGQTLCFNHRLLAYDKDVKHHISKARKEGAAYSWATEQRLTFLRPIRSKIIIDLKESLERMETHYNSSAFGRGNDVDMSADPSEVDAEGKWSWYYCAGYTNCLESYDTPTCFRHLFMTFNMLIVEHRLSAANEEGFAWAAEERKEILEIIKDGLFKHMNKHLEQM